MDKKMKNVTLTEDEAIIGKDYVVLTLGTYRKFSEKLNQYQNAFEEFQKLMMDINLKFEILRQQLEQPLFPEE